VLRVAVLTVFGAAALCWTPTATAEQSGHATPTGPTTVVVVACERFNEALNLAAQHYDEFAYATAGTGDAVNYADPQVWRSNVIGRTALREAAHSVFSASRTLGLPSEVADPMRAWSLQATKLMVIMGMRGGGDSLNAAANQLNADARDTEIACALRARG
jgi:hypothetical protein